jgi:methyltransferase (TIGR00027 family)
MARAAPAARTAIGPMILVATEQSLPPSRRIVRDDLAIQLLPTVYQLVVRATRWRVLRDLLINLSEKQAPGAWAGILCRKRYADDKVAEAIDAGIRQFVFLGAGLDSRAYRLVAPAGAEAYEIDLPDTIAHKQQRLLAIYGRMPQGVRLIPFDFESNDLLSILQGAGFRTQEPALFLWEAVTQYLTPAAMDRTLGELAGVASGSRLLFTYVLQDFLDGTNFYGGEPMYRTYVVQHRLWHFGIQPEKVGELLRPYGWIEREQVGASEYAKWYMRPLGRELPVLEIERFVAADKA